MSFFKNIFSKEKKETLDKGLEKTKENFFDKLSKAVVGKSKVDDEVLDNLEEILVASDVGVNTTLKIIERIEERVAKDKYVSTNELNKILREEIAGLLSETNTGNETDFTIPANKKPYVIMVVGVNGVGKTTTIGKLASQFKKRGFKVVLGAAGGKLDFTLTADITPVSENKSNILLNFSGNFNPMMTMMIKGPISKFIESLAKNMPTAILIN